MTKVLASKGTRGVSSRYVSDNAAAAPGEVEVQLPAGTDMGPWSETVVWDDELGGPRPRTGAEDLEAAKAEKRAELEAQLDHACQQVFPSIYVGIITMTEQKSDPRNAQVRTYSTNFDNKLRALDSARTVAEVEAVAW